MSGLCGAGGCVWVHECVGVVGVCMGCMCVMDLCRYGWCGVWVVCVFV